MSENATIAVFRAASDVLPQISDDDCNVILQDWDESDPTQRAAMRLAAEALNLREAGRKAIRALLTGQPEIRGDNTVYALDGAATGLALDALRRALRIS